MLGYGTSKAAVIGFAQLLRGLRARDPNSHDRPRPDRHRHAGRLADPQVRQRMIDATPLRRIGRPEEMAELALFLLSERASYTTGQVYVADGGRVTLP